MTDLLTAPPHREGIKWYPRVHVVKYHAHTMRDIIGHLGYEPVGDDLLRFPHDDEAFDEGNQCVNAGLSLIGNLIIGAGGSAFNSAQSILGVGSSSTAFSVTQTALSGDGSSTTAWYTGTSTAPANATGSITAAATFTTGNANFAWNEWCAATASGTLTPGGTLASVGTSPTMVNRKVTSLGTKSSGSWILSVTITLS